MIGAFRKSNQILKMSSKGILSSSYASNTNPQGLPHLPVPKLQDTLKKFLETVEPHLATENFENTKNLVKEFGKTGGIGEKLQKLLEERAQKKENWLSDPTSNWWLNCAYLQYRDPVVVWSSPGIVMPQRKLETMDDRLRYAAQVVYASMQFKRLIDAKKIPTEKMGKSELDMQQYHNVFGTCRIPGLPADSIEFNRNSTHICVAVNDVFFKVPVYNVQGEILGENQLLEQFKFCVNEGMKVKNPLKIGVLTSDNRDNWAKAYKELSKNAQNVSSLKDIQKSLFLVSIDRDSPQITDDIITGEYQFLTGAGSRLNSGNRWYDKTIQFIIGTRGINGLTYEHSPAEGGPIAILTDQVIKYADDQNAGKIQTSIGTGNFEKPKLLEFQSSAEIEDAIKQSSENIDKLNKDIDMNYLHFTDYGKNFIKTQKFSPDSYIQMAIQFAFYRLHHVPGAHYESAGTRLYVHGRTECIRSCSKQSVAFAKAMVESRDDKEKLEKMKNAINAHKNYVSQAVQGLGIDRHLLGLKLIAKENGIEVPALYSDEGYTKSSTYRLSTSQVPSAYNAFMCYGPLTYDGYGCCYSPRNNDMWFGLSSMRSNNETSSELFKKSLEEALRLMQQVLVKVGEPVVMSKL